MNAEHIPVLDREVLLRRLGGNEDVVVQVYLDIAESFPRRLEQCRQALDDRDLETIRTIAHTIKGSAATAGADRAAFFASRLDDTVRQTPPSIENVTTAFGALESSIAELIALIDSPEGVGS